MDGDRIRSPDAPHSLMIEQEVGGGQYRHFCTPPLYFPVGAGGGRDRTGLVQDWTGLVQDLLSSAGCSSIPAGKSHICIAALNAKS